MDRLCAHVVGGAVHLCALLAASHAEYRAHGLHATRRPCRHTATYVTAFPLPALPFIAV